MAPYLYLNINITVMRVMWRVFCENVKKSFFRQARFAIIWFRKKTERLLSVHFRQRSFNRNLNDL